VVRIGLQGYPLPCFLRLGPTALLVGAIEASVHYYILISSFVLFLSRHRSSRNLQNLLLILVLLLVSGALAAAGWLIRFLGLHVLGQVVAHQYQVVVRLTLWDASLRSSGLLRRSAAAVLWLRKHVSH